MGKCSYPDEQFSVLTLTPDLIAQDLLGKLLSKLSEEDIDVVAALPIHFTPALATELYGGRITHKREEVRTHSGWLNPMLFSGGSSLILYLRWSKTDISLVEKVVSMKGKSRPSERSSNSLRSISNLTDRGFSLIHSPDSIGDVYHELEVLLGKKSISAVLNCMRSPVDIAVLEEILPNVPLNHDECQFDVAFRILRQIASLCIAMPLNDGMIAHGEFFLDLIKRKHDEYLSRWRIESIVTAWPYLESLNESIRTLRQQISFRDKELSILDQRFLLRLTNALLSLEVLTSETPFYASECEELLFSLRDIGLKLNYWDEHRMRVISSYHSKS